MLENGEMVRLAGSARNQRPQTTQSSSPDRSVNFWRICSRFNNLQPGHLPEFGGVECSHGPAPTEGGCGDNQIVRTNHPACFGQLRPNAGVYPREYQSYISSECTPWCGEKISAIWMGSIMNGMSLTGGIIPYGATFLIFSDYMRPPVRLACIMDRHVIYVYTHDSIGLGEDGPTHQPIEQLSGLRAIPHMTLIRPADASETAEAWRFATGGTRRPAAAQPYSKTRGTASSWGWGPAGKVGQVAAL